MRQQMVPVAARQPLDEMVLGRVHAMP